MSKRKIISSLIGFAATLALAAPMAASAEPLVVKASDLDLATAQGQKELDRRATEAARALCRGTYMPQVNCIPGAKANIVAKAKADGSVTIARNGQVAKDLAQR